VVSKKTGAIVGGLGLEDFELYEDGVKQQIEYFGIGLRPLSIILLFDYTATVLPVIKRLAERAEQALEHLKPEDEVAVMAFNENAELLQDFTLDRPTVVAAIRRAGELTSLDDERAYLNEGVYQAAIQVGKVTDPQRRRVIVVLNDGIANVDIRRRKHKEKEALQELYEAGATVCGVTIKSLKTYIIQGAGAPLVESLLGMGNPAGSARSYAEKTGGEVVAGKTEGAAEKLAEVFDHLRAAYSLGYTPTNAARDGKFRRLKLRLNGQAQNRVGEVIIRTRQGYYPRPQSSSP
jgi:Ca-activated chloride channel family protein